MSLFNDLFSNDQKKKNNAFGLFKYLQEEDNYLTKEERKIKESENYEDYNFDSDDLEEDDK